MIVLYLTGIFIQEGISNSKKRKVISNSNRRRSFPSSLRKRDLTKLRRRRQRQHQKAMSLVRKTTTHAFFVHFLAVPARLRREMANILSVFEDGNGKALNSTISV